jgi:hypothetical protein
MAPLLGALRVFSLAMMVVVLASVRRAHIRVEYSVSWLLASALLLALSFSEFPLNRVEQFLRVSDAPAALLMIAGCIFVVVVYRSSLHISNLKDSNIALAQRVAILEYRLESLDEKVKAASAG